MKMFKNNNRKVTVLIDLCDMPASDPIMQSMFTTIGESITVHCMIISSSPEKDAFLLTPNKAFKEFWINTVLYHPLSKQAKQISTLKTLLT